MMHRCSNMVGPCTCGLFHSLLFSSSSFDHPHSDPFFYNNPSVDCTLSLATPSTRLSDSDHRRSAFCWDILQTPSAPKTTRGGSSSSNDSLVARRCANCDTTSTPLWRNGPRGPKSLCNACGIRFKKEERRASASAAAASGGVTTEQQSQFNSSWAHQTPKMPCYSPAGNEFRFGEDVDGGRDSFLSWRLNVTDRPGLVHDFTR